MDADRRTFIKSAALSGAAPAWTGGGLIAAAADQPVTSASEAVPLAPPDKQPPKLPLPEPAPRKVGWAVVGLGQLALEEVMPAFREARLSQPVALVSGHADKARKVAEAHGISADAIYSYDTYERLAENPKVEVIYVILPNSMHADFTIRLRSGKHVLCEKPMAANASECEQMIAASKETGKKLMIAYRLHYEPMTLTIAELLRKKTFGDVKTLSSSHCQNVQAPNIRLSAKLAGGPLGDLGIYSINTARMILGEEPVEVTAISHQPKDDPRFREVAESYAFTLRFPSGVLAHCDCSFGSTESRRYRVHCADGFVEMDPAFSYRGLRLRVKQGESKQSDAQLAEWQIKEVNQFAAEMDHFSQCVLENKEPRTPGADGLADMRIIAAIEEAARSERAVKI